MEVEAQIAQKSLALGKDFHGAWEMVNPMDALVKLQQAINRRSLALKPGDVHRDIGFWMDEVAGKMRLTYAKSAGRKVQAIAMFVLVDRIEGIPCFQAGYAVVEEMRQKGFASDIVTKGLEEMSNGFARSGGKKFYVEAVVGISNTASNRVAKRLLSDTPETITDEFSGERAFRYLRLIEWSAIAVPKG